MKLLKNLNFWLIIILIIGAVLRFYNLPGYLQFLGDQGRDVLIVKRMIVDHQWTLLGPNASVGGFFTGPIYYYFMLPFLWIFNLDPVGPAVLSALIGMGVILLTFYFCHLFGNNKVGLIASFLVAISPKMVDISRFSWNPNPVPFFSLLTMIFLYLAKAKGKSIFNFLAGINLGILFQLHYIDLVFVPIVGLSILLLYSWRQWLIQGGLVLVGFLLGDSLFLIFEARHGFPNLKSVWEFVNRGGQTVAPRTANPIELFSDIAHRLFRMTLSLPVWLEKTYVISAMLGLGIWVKAQPKKMILILVWLLVGVFGVGSYRGSLYDHYFGYLYPLPFILLGLTFDIVLVQKWWGKTLGLVGISILVYLSISNLYFWQKPNNMLDQVKEIGQQVLTYADGQPYNLGLISSYNSDFSYRYYLEIWGKPPVTIENPDIDPQRKTVTDRLVVICEDKKCEPLGHPTWEIAGFGRAQIVQEKIGPAGIRIFKLIHYDENQKLKILPRRQAGKS